VALADLSPKLIETARARIREAAVAVESADVVNAVNLGIYATESFDAVLAMGPFYHLIQAQEREQSLADIRRVLKPSGLAFLAIIPHLEGLADLIRRAAASPDDGWSEAFAECARSGIFRNPTKKGFQEGFYADPMEFQDWVSCRGFAVEAMISLRSLAFGQEEAMLTLEQHQPEVHETISDCIRKVAESPAVVATCGHAMCVCRRP
jgi:SAM-dependent methyltransferase